ncbi:MAG: NAD-dependent epimerase/dehydratase family protein [Geodermatophilales bacterium]|nr:NAD-dependent epimerase/dehydratase family protein [Geodermatophilales bacterium]
MASPGVPVVPRARERPRRGDPVKVVVVGATGNVGTAVVRALTADDRVSEVLGIARRRPEWQPPKTTFVAADIAEDDLVPHLRGADAVVHLAWLFQPTHSPMVTWQANAVGSARVFEAASAAGVPALVYASSVGAYSPGPGRRVDESWPTHSVPTAAYGREKAYVERLLDTFEARNPDTRVVRLRPAFIFQRQAATEQRRIFAGPLVRGRGAYNVAADPVIDAASIGEVLRARVVPVPGPLVRAGLTAAWQLHLVPAEPRLLDLALQLPLLDTTRIRTELGWSPSVSSVDALREALEGMADGAGAQTPPLASDSLAGRLQEGATGIGERST